MFKGAIFDMDGLLIDSERAVMQAWIDAALDCGRILHPSDYVRVVGLAERESNDILANLLGGREAFEAVAARVTACLERSSGIYPIKNGVRELLACLSHARVPLEVASSSRRDKIEHRLMGVDILRHFQAYAGGDEVPCGKPDPAVYWLAAGRLGLPPEHCLAFEDSENGARAALAAGMQVVLVPDLKVAASAVSNRCLMNLSSLEQTVDIWQDWFELGIRGQAIGFLAANIADQPKQSIVD